MPRRRIEFQVRSQAAVTVVVPLHIVRAQISQAVSRWLLFATGMTLLLAASMATAQSTTGSIYGQVTDPSNAVIVAARALALNQGTGVSYAAESDKEGNYAVFNLPPGLYQVTVQKQGFQSATIKNVRIEIEQKQLLDFKMKIGASGETMTITAAPTLLQTETVETGNIVHPQDVLDLPLLGRNFLDLVALTPGVTAVGGSINQFNFAVSGGREYANSIQIDGVESTTNRTQDITVTPSVDSVEEFKVSTSAYAAEFGSSAGGSVAIQTKGGTNSFHGTAYEFFRPNFTAAKDYSFTGGHIPPSILKQHNYGGTLGGPIRKNKTFFFVSFEQTHLKTAFDYVYFTEPKNQVKFLPDGSVDFSGLIDPFTGTQIPIYDPTVMLNCYGFCPQQFTNNIIPANRVSPAGVNIFNNFIPSPNLAGTNFGWFNNFQVHSPVTTNQKNVDARLDHNISDKDNVNVVFHYSNGDSLTTDPYWGATVVPGAGDGDQGNHETYGAQEYAITENHFFSARMVNEVRFGYTRYSQNQYSLLNGHDYSTQYGLNNVAVPGYPATDAFPWIFMGIGNFFGGSTYKPFLIQDDNYQLSDNLIMSQVSKHEFKVGGNFRALNSRPNFSLFPTDFLFFAGPYAAMTSDWSFTSPLDNFNALYGSGGNDMADLLMGLPLDVQRGLQLTNPHTRSWEMAFYAQDSYRLSPRLTLNYGVRYEYQAPYTEAGDNASNYDIATDSLLLAGRGGNSPGLIASRWTNFGPRAGVSIQLTPKTVLRAGYGFFYSPENDGREDRPQHGFTGTMYNRPLSFEFIRNETGLKEGSV